MPLLHCNKCHHEWEGRRDICDWCGASGKVIAKETPFEHFMRTFDFESYLKENKCKSKK